MTAISAAIIPCLLRAHGVINMGTPSRGWASDLLSWGWFRDSHQRYVGMSTRGYFHVYRETVKEMMYGKGNGLKFSVRGFMLLKTGAAYSCIAFIKDLYFVRFQFVYKAEEFALVEAMTRGEVKKRGSNFMKYIIDEADKQNYAETEYCFETNSGDAFWVQPPPGKENSLSKVMAKYAIDFVIKELRLQLFDVVDYPCPADYVLLDKVNKEKTVKADVLRSVKRMSSGTSGENEAKDFLASNDKLLIRVRADGKEVKPGQVVDPKKTVLWDVRTEPNTYMFKWWVYALSVRRLPPLAMVDAKGEAWYKVYKEEVTKLMAGHGKVVHFDGENDVEGHVEYGNVDWNTKFTQWFVTGRELFDDYSLREKDDFDTEEDLACEDVEEVKEKFQRILQHAPTLNNAFCLPEHKRFPIVPHLVDDETDTGEAGRGTYYESSLRYMSAKTINQLSCIISKIQLENYRLFLSRGLNKLLVLAIYVSFCKFFMGPLCGVPKGEHPEDGGNADPNYDGPVTKIYVVILAIMIDLFELAYGVHAKITGAFQNRYMRFIDMEIRTRYSYTGLVCIPVHFLTADGAMVLGNMIVYAFKEYEGSTSSTTAA